LLVEDSEPQIIQLTDILRNEGYIIQVARNGREALDAIKIVIPDAMILDLQMPDVDGFEVLREIRNLRETKSIPVLILTAKHITKSELSFLKENHIYQLIQKGAVNRNDLLAYVNNLMISKLKSNPVPVKPKKSQKNKDEKATILVIEDNTDNLITLKALLEEKYIIFSSTDGSEGVEKALTVNPDLVLLDISLPGMDGFKVLDEIRNSEKLNKIPVVALTARARKGDRENLLAYGFDGYIAKPIDGETFEKTIREYLGNRQ
jgi:CheY-like chemotaxis protein